MEKNKLSDYLYLYRWLIGIIGRRAGLHRAFKGLWCFTIYLQHNGKRYGIDVSFSIGYMMKLNINNDDRIKYMHRIISNAIMELSAGVDKSELAKPRDNSVI